MLIGGSDVQVKFVPFTVFLYLRMRRSFQLARVAILYVSFDKNLNILKLIGALMFSEEDFSMTIFFLHGR